MSKASSNSSKQTRQFGNGGGAPSLKAHVAKASAKPTSKQTRQFGTGNFPASIQAHFSKLS